MNTLKSTAHLRWLKDMQEHAIDAFLRARGWESSSVARVQLRTKVIEGVRVHVNRSCALHIESELEECVCSPVPGSTPDDDCPTHGGW